MSRSATRSLAVALTLAFMVPVLVEAAAPFDLEGHRGARGLAPENTLAAFRTALAIGVTTLEGDLAVTRDGVLVLSHERALNPDLVRDSDGRWLESPGPPIHRLSLDELRRFDVGRLNPSSRYAQNWPEQRASDGERIPTLAELIALMKAHPTPVRLNLETKIDPRKPDDTVAPAEFARLVIDEVRQANLADRITIQSFDWRTLVEVKRIAPEVPTACLTIQTRDNDTVSPTSEGPSPWHAGLDLRKHGGSLPRLAKAAGCAVWSMFWRNLTPALTAEARSLGLTVLPWTVNEPADMARLIDDGVDGIITDYPDRLRRVMKEKGMPLP